MSDHLDLWRWIVEQEDEGCRLDHFLRDAEVGLSRSKLQKLIENGCVKVDQCECRPAQKLRAGQEVVLCVPPPEPLTIVPEEMPLDVRYEDEFVVVVNKPQGLVVHPAPGHYKGTLVHGILYNRTAGGGDPTRPGIVHRLDKDTSGLIVVAKTDDAHISLAKQLSERTVERRYKVLVVGSPPAKGEWKTLYGRHPRDRRRFSSKVSRGKSAISIYETLERFPNSSMLQVKLLTGRTHQVRVHCHDHGFPVLGDPLYGPNRLDSMLKEVHLALPGQALHAELLSFDHPATGKRMSFEAETPDHFKKALRMLRGS